MRAAKKVLHNPTAREKGRFAVSFAVRKIPRTLQRVWRKNRIRNGGNIQIADEGMGSLARL